MRPKGLKTTLAKLQFYYFANVLNTVFYRNGRIRVKEVINGKVLFDGSSVVFNREVLTKIVGGVN